MNYDKHSAVSIFKYSRQLIGHTLSEVVSKLHPDFDVNRLTMNGKGQLGQLVEKYFYEYDINSDPGPDFREAGLELKTTPLKKGVNGNLLIKERLVCDMIDYCEVVNMPFENSLFYIKSQLMLIIFYLHLKGVEARDLRFIYSVMWRLTGKDLAIIRHDYETIIEKIRSGHAHEISEGDTMYLAACRKGSRDSKPRRQPFSDISAPGRAFSLKASYMRTILQFVENSGDSLATNDTDIKKKMAELVSVDELQDASFEQILTQRLMAFKGKDYKQIAEILHIKINPRDKAKYFRITMAILLKGLKNFEDAEEIKKAGIIAKTVRVEKNGTIIENMSFENIDYNEIYENDDFYNSRWYEIITSKFMFVVYREAETGEKEEEKRYVLDGVIFWTMPEEDMTRAEEYWQNIRENVMADTLGNDDNTFWTMGDNRDFHVRPKAQTGKDTYLSPISGKVIPKKCYWFNRDYVKRIINTH